MEPAPHQWAFGPGPGEFFAVVFPNYLTESGFATIDTIARTFVRLGHVPAFDNDSNSLVEANVRRLEENENVPEDFDGVIVCRPRLGMPPDAEG